MSEIWIAKEDADDKIVFEVLDEPTGETRIEERLKSELPRMFQLGGNAPPIGSFMMTQELPWRFRKVGENIYLDGPSIGADHYHPIDKEA